MSKNNLAKNLKALIRERRFKLSEISKATGIPISTLSEWTNGDRVPSIGVPFLKLTEFLGVSVEKLLKGEDPITEKGRVDPVGCNLFNLHSGLYRITVEKCIKRAEEFELGENSGGDQNMESLIDLELVTDYESAKEYLTGKINLAPNRARTQISIELAHQVLGTGGFIKGVSNNCFDLYDKGNLYIGSLPVIDCIFDINLKELFPDLELRSELLPIKSDRKKDRTLFCFPSVSAFARSFDIMKECGDDII